MFRKLILGLLVVIITLSGCSLTEKQGSSDYKYKFSNKTFSYSERLELFNYFGELKELNVLSTPDDLIANYTLTDDNSELVKYDLDDESYITLITFDNEKDLTELFNVITQDYDLEYDNDSESRNVNSFGETYVLFRPNRSNYLIFFYYSPNDDSIDYRKLYNDALDFMDNISNQYLSFNDKGKLVGKKKLEKKLKNDY